MATLRASRFLGFLRYPLTPLSSLFSPRFISIDVHPSTNKLSEGVVLEELSDLLFIDLKPPNPRPFLEKAFQEPAMLTSVRDQVLSPDEKLRGVFLQKLRGKSAVESALSAAGVELTQEVFADVLNKGSLSGRAMVSFYDWAIEQPKLGICIENYNVMLKALGRRKFFKFMEEFLVRMKKDGIEPNSKTLQIVMDSYLRARRVTKSVMFFKNLEEIGLKCNLESLNVLLCCLCRRSHVSVANSLFNSLKEEMPFNITTFNVLIGGWAKFGRVDKIEIFWMMMLDDGLSPDNITYSHIVEALGRSGQIDEAVEVFEKMEQKGCIPDSVAYDAIISNFISSGDLEQSIKYYKIMCGKKCYPDIGTYSKLICSLLKGRRVADALELFDEMICQGAFPSTGMITSIIEPLCSFGPPHAAMLIYNKCRKLGCKLSMKAYKLLLMRLSIFGKCGLVLKLWEEMQGNGYDSDKEVYEYIINGLCNIGQVDNAVLVVEESLRKGFCLGKAVYRKLNKKLLDLNKVEIAYRLFLKVKSARLASDSRNLWRLNGWHY